MSVDLIPADIDRFWAKVQKSGSGGCWTWTAAVMSRGYGCFRVNRTNTSFLAHRLAWELERCAVPYGFTLDHRCGNLRCVNPDHLEITTRRVNTWRGQGKDWKGDMADIVTRVALYPAVGGLIPLRDVAPLVGLGEQAVRRAVYSGELPGVTRGTRTNYIRQTALLAFVVARAHEDAGVQAGMALCAMYLDNAA